MLPLLLFLMVCSGLALCYGRSVLRETETAREFMCRKQLEIIAQSFVSVALQQENETELADAVYKLPSLQPGNDEVQVSVSVNRVSDLGLRFLKVDVSDSLLNSFILRQCVLLLPEHLHQQFVSSPVVVLSSDAQESAEGSKLAEEDSFATFIKTADADSFEQEDTYYRWRYDTALDTELLLANLQVRYEKSPGNIRQKKGNGYVDEKPEKLGMVTGLTAVKRTTGGVMTELLIEGTEDTYRVCGEQNIRYVLAGENTKIALGADYGKDGSINGMLPSSFFVIEPVYETDDGISTEKAKEAPVVISYTLYGGGFGHGIGMSQNAARRMAQAGYDYKQILQFFYECSIEGVNE